MGCITKHELVNCEIIVKKNGVKCNAYRFTNIRNIDYKNKFIETNNGVYCLEDFEQFENLDSMILAFNECACKCNTANEQQTEPREQETLLPCNFEIKDGEELCLSDLIAEKGAKGVAGFDFDLKCLNGETYNKFTATSADATSNGDHGERDLDGAGSFNIGICQYQDGTFRRLGEQCFKAADGSIAELLIEFIF